MPVSVKTHSFYASLGHEIQQQQLLSSASDVGAPKAYLRKGIIIWRSVFVVRRHRYGLFYFSCRAFCLAVRLVAPPRHRPRREGEATYPPACPRARVPAYPHTHVPTYLRFNEVLIYRGYNGVMTTLTTNGIKILPGF